jgi:hypothetical protein
VGLEKLSTNHELSLIECVSFYGVGALNSKNKIFAEIVNIALAKPLTV